MIDAPQPEPRQNAELRRLMDLAFNLDGLRTLCFDLEYDFDKFGGEAQGKTAVIRKIIEHADSQNDLDNLIAACAEAAPSYDWPTGPLPDQPCPYRGLFAFREEDEHLFFGREAFSKELAEFVLARPLTTVIGPSGSGKSSVVFAGLVPTLRQLGNWLVINFRPGERPFRSLVAVLLPHFDPTLSKVDQLAETNKLEKQLKNGEVALNQMILGILGQQPPGSRLLLIADQFEELFTLCTEPETRHSFLRLLLNQTIDEAESESQPDNMHMVFTLRADFMGQALNYPALVTALQTDDIKLGPMTPDELRRVIVEPAKRANVHFEEGLVERILDDVGTDGRNLPLLEFALTELWQQQSNRRLIHSAYERIGQVHGALARHADNVYNNLTVEEKTLVERIFVQLVHPGAGAEDTRRLATKEELGQANWPLVQKLAGSDNRLLVTDRDESSHDTAEVIHEALIQRWELLQIWMNTHREFRAWQDRLRTDLKQWQTNNEDPSYLLSGAYLAIALEYLKNNRQMIRSGEIAFIVKSREEAERKEREEKVKARKVTLRLIALSAVLAAAVFIAIILGLSSRSLASENESLAATAIADRDLADSRLRLIELNLQISGNPVEDLITAYQAANTTSSLDESLSEQAYSALYNTLKLWSQGVLAGHVGSANSGQFSPDGSLLLTAGADGTARLWNAAGLPVMTLIGEPKKTLFGGSASDEVSQMSSAEFSPSGELILTASDDGIARLWSSTTGEMLMELSHDDSVNSAHFSRDGRYILTASDDHFAYLWSSDGNKLESFRHDDAVKTAVFDSQTALILTTSQDNFARLWNLDGTLIAELGHDDLVNSAVFSADGNHILTASDDNSARLWSRTGEFRQTFLHTEDIKSAIFSPDGNFILTLNNDYSATLWTVAGETVNVLDHANQINSIIFSIDGERILTAGDDGTARLWDKEGTLISIMEHSSGVNTAVFDNNNGHILTTTISGISYLWDHDGKSINVYEGHSSPISQVIFSPVGNQFITYNGEEARIWNMNGDFVASLSSENFLAGAYFSDDGEYIITFETNARDESNRSDAITGFTLWNNRGLPADDVTVGPLNESDSSFSSDKDINFIYGPLDNYRSDLFAQLAINDGTVFIRDVGGTVADMLEHDSIVRYVEFSPIANQILTVTWEGQAYIWQESSTPNNWDERDRITLVEGSFDNDVIFASYSPQGDYIATAHDNGKVRIWDTEGEWLFDLDGHLLQVNAIAFDTNGDQIITASNDDTIRIWDTTGRNLVIINEHKGDVLSLSISPDGKHLLSGSADNTARLWPNYGDLNAMIATAEEYLHILLLPDQCALNFDEAFCAIAQNQPQQ
ncbi:MAG: WD40 repeat domain-containing protein [Anaerolineales bacterium]|nr:WD40 repeat domain-containing protein [Anaerolineales bacterium]